MKFYKNTNEEQIVTALLTGQRNIKLNGIEIMLNPLKRDTSLNKMREAEAKAKEIVKLLK
tara:strand:- start:463 stop:642 length:180 start_codon:yes stop_codon:yes gene_type:complete